MGIWSAATIARARVVAPRARQGSKKHGQVNEEWCGCGFGRGCQACGVLVWAGVQCLEGNSRSWGWVLAVCWHWPTGCHVRGLMDSLIELPETCGGGY